MGTVLPGHGEELFLLRRFHRGNQHRNAPRLRVRFVRRPKIPSHLGEPRHLIGSVNIGDLHELGGIELPQLAIVRFMLLQVPKEGCVR